jgi:hypothetical protein
MAFFVALNYFTCGLWNHPSPCILPVKNENMKKTTNRQRFGPVGLNQKAQKKSKPIQAVLAFKLIDNYTVIQQTSVIFIP